MSAPNIDVAIRERRNVDIILSDKNVDGTTTLGVSRSNKLPTPYIILSVKAYPNANNDSLDDYIQIIIAKEAGLKADEAQAKKNLFKELGTVDKARIVDERQPIEIELNRMVKKESYIYCVYSSQGSEPPLVLVKVQLISKERKLV